MAPYALVTPASRGIGFCLTRHLLKTTSLPIIATARRDTEIVKRNILRDLEGVEGDGDERLTVLELDVTNEATITHAASRTKSLFPPSIHHLHLAFSLPGILYPEKSPSQLDHAHHTHTFAVNTIGPLLLFKHFSPFLPRKTTPLPLLSPLSSSSSFKEEGTWTLPPHATYLNMSARVGSTSDNKLGGWYSYRSSKAAVNSMTKSFDIWVKQRSGDKALVMAYHPGTVKTGLSREFWENVKEGKLFSPESAVEKMVRVVGGLGVEGRARCWDWKGEEVLP